MAFSQLGCDLLIQAATLLLHLPETPDASLKPPKHAFTADFLTRQRETRTPRRLVQAAAPQLPNCRSHRLVRSQQLLQ